MAYAKVLVSVDGGALTRGGVSFSGTSSAVQLSLESLAGISTVQWEIYGVPPGETNIGPGWTYSATTKSFTSSALTPALITFTPSNQWGKYLVRATANGGLEGGKLKVSPPDGTSLCDESTCLEYAYGALHRRDLAPHESTQFDSLASWIGAYRETIRALVPSPRKVTTASVTPGLIAAYGRGTLVVTVDSVDALEDIIVTPTAAPPAGIVIYGVRTAADTVTIYLQNVTNAGITPPAQIYRVSCYSTARNYT